MPLPPISLELAAEPIRTTSWRRARASLTAVLVALGLGALLAACGSSSKPPTSAQVRQRTCKRVEGVLSNGPDPEADPVGYAQAQILPLGQIHSSDAGLARAIQMLASAYRELSQNYGSSSAKTAVDRDTKAIETLCPGIEL